MNKKTTKSYISKLKENNKVTDNLLVGIGSLTLEDLIAIKLELCANDINNRLFGFDIWRKTSYIVKDAVLKFSISTTKSKKDAARFLGITPTEFYKACRSFKILESFDC